MLSYALTLFACAPLGATSKHVADPPREEGGRMRRPGLC
jgi:hypothetical protein